MEHANEQPDWQMVAAQLRCPDGEAGIETGKRMQESNTAMIHTTIDSMSIGPGETILELGFGNGAHIGYLFGKAPDLAYTGADMSEAMMGETAKNNPEHIENGTVRLLLTDGKSIPLADNTFDKIFTVNTVYFWENPVAYAKEILRVLKPGGAFYMAFGEKEFMQAMPFTAFGFTLYTGQEAKHLLASAGFAAVTLQSHHEIIGASNGDSMQRTYHIAVAVKT